MPTSEVFEGTWEEIARQAGRLARKRVRLVVIENGREHIGQQVQIGVTSVIQKSAGRMVFGRFDAGK